MSAAGLVKFIDGSTPTPPVLRKLQSWHARLPAAPQPPPVVAAPPPPVAEAEEEWRPPRIVLRYTPEE